MGPLEATVEIMKAALLSPAGGESTAIGATYLLESEEGATKLAKAFEIIYKKIRDVQTGK